MGCIGIFQIRKLFFLLILVLPADLFGVSQKDWTNYEACVSELKSASQEYQKKIPLVVWLIDSEMRFMNLGIGAISDNLMALKKMNTEKEIEGFDQHRVWNASSSCQNFLATYKKRASLLYYLTLCIYSLSLVGFVWFVLWWTTKKKSEKVERAPADRKVS